MGTTAHDERAGAGAAPTSGAGGEIKLEVVIEDEVKVEGPEEAEGAAPAAQITRNVPPDSKSPDRHSAVEDVRASRPADHTSHLNMSPQSPGDERLQELLEPCIEFHTIKLEPLDYVYSDSDSCGAEPPAPPSPASPRAAPRALPADTDLPEPGFSMTVPLKKLRPRKRKREPAAGVFECAVCRSTYASKVRLARHVVKHARRPHGEPIACDHCAKTFDFKYQLAKHAVRHSRDRPHACSECDKTFRYKESLRLHVKRHAEHHEVCDECGKVFLSYGGVVRHKKRMHAPAGPEHRPFGCAQCGARFRNNRNLTIHARTHSGERPYACRFCDKSFFDASTLNRHVRIHTGVKPYACELCAASFSDAGSLTFHVRRHHTGERPHQCVYCGAAYHHRSNLKRHLRTHLPAEATAGKEGKAAGRAGKAKAGAEKKAKPRQKRGRKVVVKIEPADDSA